MRHLSLFAAVAVAGLVACSTESTLQPNQPAVNALIVDGAHAGNPNFFFLPPLVPSPVGTANFDAGQFNAQLSPFVEVCELTADPRVVPTADCVSPTARAFGPARMTLDAGNEQYTLNWDTKASPLNLAAFYRIIVRGSSRGTPLGFLDVDPVSGGMKNIKTGDTYAFQDGRTLPIKVRIEQGAFGSTNSNDRVEQVVPALLPPTGLDITTNTGFAGAHFPNGWLPPGFDQVVVIIERIAPNCLNTALEQLEGCYRFRTDPDLHGLGPDGTDLHFALPVIAGVCFQFPGDVSHENQHPFELLRSEEINGVVTPAVPLLDEQPAPFLRCDSFTATPPSIGAAFRSGRIGDIAMAGLYAVTHTIGRVIQPAALHAVDFGAGGSTNDFSRFGYGRRAFMAVTAGQGATAPAGSTVSAAVRVRDVHHDDTTDVVGQSVTFTVTAGGGTVSTATCSEGTSCSANTNSGGVADVTWRLGLGPNAIQVTTTHVTNSPQTITATGVAATLSGYQVLSSQVVTLDAGNGFDREAVACPTGTKVFGGGAAVVGEGSSNFHTRLQESGPGTIGGGAQDDWLVSIKNLDVVSHDIQIYAICGNPPAGYTVVSSADIPLASGAFTRQSATCPAGTKVFGGGVAVVGEGTADFNTRVQESGPGTVNGGAQDSWLVSVKNTDAVSHTVRISAICANPPTGYQVIVSGDIALSDAAGGSSFNRQSVLCPVGLSILGGGAQVIGEGTADFDTRIGESSPGTIGGGAEDVWLASLTNESGNPHTMAIRAVCATATGP